MANQQTKNAAMHQKGRVEEQERHHREPDPATDELGWGPASPARWTGSTGDQWARRRLWGGPDL
eukprot:1134791-Pyramimonas_sp.AAC.1